MSTVIITGGAGFIGSHVAKAYLRAGHRVVVVDDLSTGRRNLVSEGAEFVHLDVTDPSLITVFQRIRPDVVNHLAAQVSVVRSTREPQADAAINVVGSSNVLDAAARCGAKRFIFSSTGGALYGEPQSLPCAEDHPIAPLSPYGVAKYCVEQYIRYFARVRGLPAVILRYGNVYGPGQDPYGEAGVVAIFTQKMLKKEQCYIFGTGEQERDFVYVEDVAQANVTALDKGVGEAINIGTGEAISVLRLYALLAQLTGCAQQAEHKPENPGEVFRIYLDASKAKRVLGWQPRVSFAEGLRRTVEAFRRAIPL